jgi:hypothetical protein
MTIRLAIREQLMSLARRVRHNTYRHGMERFVIEREAIADTLDRMAEEVGT